MRVGLLEDRGEQVARLDLLPLGALGVRERALHHAVERERLAGLVGPRPRRLAISSSRKRAARLQPREVGADVAQHLGAALVVRSAKSRCSTVR